MTERQTYIVASYNSRRIGILYFSENGDACKGSAMNGFVGNDQMKQHVCCASPSSNLFVAYGLSPYLQN